MSRSTYVFVHSGPGEAGAGRRNAVVRHLESEGWRMAGQTPGGRLLTAPGFSLPVRPLGPNGLLAGRHTSPPPDRGLDPEAHAEALVTKGWGRYLAFWSTQRTLHLFRDPGGALDAVIWRDGELTVAASSTDPALDPLLPAALDLDWSALRRLATSVTDAGYAVPLRGLIPVPPGGLAAAQVGVDITVRSLWKPADFTGRRTPRRAPALREVVDQAVRECLRPYGRVVGEISGGFDSAVVATTAQRVAPGRVETFINYHGEEAEGDERRYAHAVAGRLGVPLECRAKQPRAIRLEDLAPLTDGFRPALHGLDVEYDQDMAVEMAGRQHAALLTGQGGDAVFFQFVAPALAVDRVRRLGPLGLGPGFLYSLARATHRSVWALGGMGLNALAGRPASVDRAAPAEGAAAHPWLEGIERLPPAKAGQVRALANSLVFWGDCRRARAGDLVHPLLSQPVLEHCLALPADVLAPNGRERGLARRAFADRLPEAVLDRRGKGELSTYYGQVVLLSLPAFRPLLLDGMLVREGVLDRTETERLLDPNALVWSGDYNLVLIRVLLELWAVRWTDRLRGIRSAKMQLQPIDHPPVKVDDIGRT